MAKMFRRKTGLVVVSGKVLGVKNTNAGKEIQIGAREMDQQTKSWVDRSITAVTQAAGDDIAVGKVATAIGYQSGMDIITAFSVTTGPDVRYVEDVEVVSGPISRAEYRSELNEDGTQKLKRDGSPRKPHFDITIRVPDEDGHNVLHRIKIYNFVKTQNPGDKSEIEKMQAIFSKWVNKDETPVMATIVTRPGTFSNWESEFNGRVYQNFASDHLGKFSMDLNWETPSPVRTVHPQNQNAASLAPDQAQQTAPQQSRTYGNGITIDEDSYL